MRFSGILPDLFKEGEGMIGLGRYEGGTFQATEILAKHDETYMPREGHDALKEQGVYQAPNGSEATINTIDECFRANFIAQEAAQMVSVRAIAEEIVAREGGYVNDPDDPGGATNFGVTIHTMRRLGLDLNRTARLRRPM